MWSATCPFELLGTHVTQTIKELRGELEATNPGPSTSINNNTHMPQRHWRRCIIGTCFIPEGLAKSTTASTTNPQPPPPLTEKEHNCYLEYVHDKVHACNVQSHTQSNVTHAACAMLALYIIHCDTYDNHWEFAALHSVAGRSRLSEMSAAHHRVVMSGCAPSGLHDTSTFAPGV